jgi:hypothetical protein
MSTSLELEAMFLISWGGGEGGNRKDTAVVYICVVKRPEESWGKWLSCGSFNKTSVYDFLVVRRFTCASFVGPHTCVVFL